MGDDGREPLPTLAVEIDARPELVYQLVAAVGQGPDASHGRVLERPAPDRAIVEFTTRVVGRTVRTIEEVGFHPPGLITYRLLKGPLPAVDEEFRIQSLGEKTALRYGGTFVPHRPWWRAAFDRLIVPRLYRRAVWASMCQIKSAAEKRQRESRVFPRKEFGGNL